jgi:PKD repeat protein
MVKRKIALLQAFVITGVFFISAFNLSAQDSKESNYSAEEKKSIAIMKRDGVPDASIDKWVMHRRLVSLKDKNINIKSSRSGPLPGVNANSCGDMGGENGWSGWQASVGDYADQGNVNTITYSQSNVSPTLFPARFVLTTGTGTDACTPGPAANSPPLPVVAPGFGNRSIQLGERTTTGMQGGCNRGCVERLTYSFTVSKADTNFIYAYAFVFDFRMNNGQPDHTAHQVPFAEIYILDAKGDTVKCSHQKYMGDTLGQTSPTPGLYETDPACAFGDAARYKPWTVVGVNLSKYLGQNITIYIVNADCSQGGHYCHSYWDFMCPPLASSITPFCTGQSTTMVAPISDLQANQYSYQWYINTKPYDPIHHWTAVPAPLGIGGNYIVKPNVGDTFAVQIIQKSTCNFWIPYIPAPTAIKADFSNKGNCGKMTFQDMSVVLPAASTNTVIAWKWSFPGGSPSSSSSQNPGTVNYPPGTYTVTLVSTSTAGCKDSIKHVFTVGGFPTAAFTPTSPCLGVATTLTDQSLPVQGDPIASWNWFMPGGSPATASSTSSTASHNISTIYSVGGTHIVTLVVSSLSGCIDTIVQQVLVYNPPIANFLKPDSGCSPLTAKFTDNSKPVDGNIASWQWSFPGGSPSTAAVQNPTGILYSLPGTYSVSLSIVTSYGCKDSIKLPMIEVYPWPTSEFCVAPKSAPTTAPVFNFCDMWSSDVVKWSWDFGDGSPLDLKNTNPVHSYSATANNNDFYKYTICIEVENVHGCWDTTCHSVELIPEFVFYIPNTFTPNGDHFNQMFFGKCRGVKEYDIWVFDRWGNQVWDCHRDDKNTNWDSDATNPKQEGLASSCQWDGVVVKGGMDMSGNSRNGAQEDVYVWKVKLLDIFDKRHTYIGHVNIVK